MPGTYDPKKSGFRRFSEARNIAIHGGIQPQFRTKLVGSTFNVKKGHPLIVGASGTYDRVAVTGTNEQHTLTFAGTVTSFTLAFTGRDAVTGVSVTRTTPAIAYNADFTVLAASVQTQLELLSNVGVDNVSVVRTSATVLTVTYTGLLSGRNVAILVSAPTGGGTLTVAASVAGVDGYVTSTALLGFADKFEIGTIDNWQRHFPQPIDLNLDGDTAEAKTMCIYPLTAQTFRGAIEHDVLATSALIDTTASIGWYPSREQCYVATTIATNAVVKIVGVAPDQEGVPGGIVDFIVLAANIAVS